MQALLSLQAVTSCGHDDGGSQVSPDSTTLLPHTGEQSGSVLALHDDGQHPSRGPQVVIVMCRHCAVQVSAEPTIASEVQTLPSSQSASVGHAPGMP